MTQPFKISQVLTEEWLFTFQVKNKRNLYQPFNGCLILHPQGFRDILI